MRLSWVALTTCATAAACGPCTDQASLEAASAVKTIAEPGVSLATVLFEAATHPVYMDAQIAGCGSALPLRAFHDVTGTDALVSGFSGYRGRYSPTHSEDEHHDNWTFPDARFLADRVQLEATRTHCTEMFLGFKRTCGAHGFRVALRDGIVVSSQPVEPWK